MLFYKLVRSTSAKQHTDNVVDLVPIDEAIQREMEILFLKNTGFAPSSQRVLA